MINFTDTPTGRRHADLAQIPGLKYIRMGLVLGLLLLVTAIGYVSTNRVDAPGTNQAWCIYYYNPWGYLSWFGSTCTDPDPLPGYGVGGPF